MSTSASESRHVLQRARKLTVITSLAGVESGGGYVLAGLPARADVVATAARDVRAEISAERGAVDRGRDARQALPCLANEVGTVVRAVVPARTAVELVRCLAGADASAAAETDALAVVVAGVAGAAAAGTRGTARGRSTGARG